MHHSFPKIPEYSKRSVKNQFTIHPNRGRVTKRRKEVGRTRVPRHATNNKAPSAWPRCCKDRIDASLHLVAVHRCAPLHASAPDPRSLHLHARRSTTSNRTTDFKLAPALSPNCVNALTKLNFISFETLTALIVPPSSSFSSSSSSNSRKLHTQCVSSSENWTVSRLPRNEISLNYICSYHYVCCNVQRNRKRCQTLYVH